MQVLATLLSGICCGAKRWCCSPWAAHNAGLQGRGDSSSAKSPGGRMGWSWRTVPTPLCWPMDPWWSTPLPAGWRRQPFRWGGLWCVAQNRFGLVVSRKARIQAASRVGAHTFSPGHGGIKGSSSILCSFWRTVSAWVSWEEHSSNCSGGIISFTHLTDWNAIWQAYSQTLLCRKRERENKLYSALGSVCLSFHMPVYYEHPSLLSMIFVF